MVADCWGVVGSLSVNVKGSAARAMVSYGGKSGRVQGPMEVLLRKSVLPECVLAIADLLCSIKH